MGKRSATLFQSLQGVGESLLRRAPLTPDVFRQSSVMAETAHRPWPLPDRPWLMGQTWTSLLFAHWPVPASALGKVVPPQLPLDTYDGSAWLGVTPFRVEGLRLRGTAPVPGLSSFPEINVRTYVTIEGKPGIYFLSLDADSRAAVRAARHSYRLPYFRSRISMREEEKETSFNAMRVSGDGPEASFRARYGPEGQRLPQRPGSLERWLTERYCLYAFDESERLHRGEIHHPPWPLHGAWAEIDASTMARPYGIDLEEEPLLHFSARHDVALWPIAPI